MKKIIAVFLLLGFVLVTYTADISGKVIKVYDGDTIRIEDFDGGKYKVRFADIDAPEKDQICGEDAKLFLINILRDKAVNVHFTSIDQYGRIVGTVYLENDISVNAMLVKNGFAWWYRDYSKNKDFGKLELEAKNKRIGIWKETNPVPPWKYRKDKKTKMEETKK